MSDTAQLPGRRRKRPRGSGGRPSLGAWTLAWVGAEGIGMTAAAGAARIAAGMSDVGTAQNRVAALGVVVAGGLVEGLALGILPGRLLSRWLPGLRLRLWVLVTVAFAGVGWAAASAPAVLGGQDDGPEPGTGVVLLGAAGLGLVMGLLLGAAQALVLRAAVTPARRWVAASVAGWVPAMVVIFAGATLPQDSWSSLTVVLTGTVTGVLAGAVLGLVTGAFLPMLTVPSPGGDRQTPNARTAA